MSILQVAQTHLQLYQELESLGYFDIELTIVSSAYQLATELFSSQFRGSGKPFVCHLIGTASILAQLQLPFDVVGAGLLHAAYSLGRFDTLPRGISPEKRQLVQAFVGSGIESLIAQYTDWKLNAQTLPIILDQCQTFTGVEIFLTLMRLADRLEDALDLGNVYCANAKQRLQFLQQNRDKLVSLAHTLGYPTLGNHLAGAIAQNLEALLLPSLQCRHAYSYSILPISTKSFMQTKNNSSQSQAPKLDESTVTIVVVPREGFSRTQTSLESLYQHTQYPFQLIYLDINSPPHIQQYLVGQAEARNFKLIRVEHFLSPNQARNLAIPYINTRYVVFIDNDVTVTPDWLDALVQCAEETEAVICTPLILFPPATEHSETSEDTYPYNANHVAIHSAGGLAHFEGMGGKKLLVRQQNFQNQPLSIAQSNLRRVETELAEFHCILIRTSIFKEVGVFDEGYFSVREDTDFCLLVREHGHHIYFEPRSVIFYYPPINLEMTDLPFFFLRWSRGWTECSLDHFHQKWEIEPEPAKSAVVLKWVERHYKLGAIAQQKIERSAPYYLHSSQTLWRELKPSTPICLSDIETQLERAQQRTAAIKQHLELIF